MPYYLHAATDTDLTHRAYCADRIDRSEVRSVLQGIVDASSPVCRMPDGQIHHVRNVRITFVLEDDDIHRWQQRERSRRQQADYTPVPWPIRPECNDHYAYLSATPEHRGKVAFSRSPEHGAQDRQTVMTPGRYLTEFYRDIYTASEIEQWAGQCASTAVVLHTSNDPDMIERVYTHGPDSCMSHAISDYSSCDEDGDPIHPTRVYGGPNSDLAIAWTGTANGTHASARTLVWPAKKIHSRIYGYESLIQPLLAQAGYRQGSLAGARVTAIQTDRRGCYVMPYVDYIEYASLTRDGQSFRLDEDGGTIHVQVTGGTSHSGDYQSSDEPETEACAHCGDDFDPNDMTDGFCEHCNNQRVTCDYCERASSPDPDDWTCLESGNYVCPPCWRRHAITCDVVNCHTQWIEDDTFTETDHRARVARGVESLCADCAEDLYACSECSDYSTDINTCSECGSEHVRRPACASTLPLPVDVASILDA